VIKRVDERFQSAETFSDDAKNMITLPGNAVVFQYARFSRSEMVAAPETTAKPRIRWGAVAWGLIAIAIAVTAMVITGSPDNRTAFAEWLAQLTAATMWLIAVFVVGGIILLLGLLAVLRRGHRGR
jgi:hypothetical protein